MHTTYRTDTYERRREVTNLFEIYGAVDLHLELRLRSEETEQVSRLLPVYRRRDAHWFRDFSRGTGLVEQWDLDDPQSRVRRALEALAQSKPQGPMRARRLFAVAVAAHAFPELPPRELAAAALGARELEEGGEADARANQLAALLRSDPETDDAPGRDAWWDRLLSSGLIPEPSGVGPRPCSGRLAWVDLDGDRDLVPTLKTVLEAPISFDAAKEFCNPINWTCFPCWCDMQPAGKENGFDRYQEIVSFDCDNDAFPRLTVNLNFFTELEDGPPRAETAEYWLSDDQPENKVLVNQGWLEVRELSPPPHPSVRITTTKSIKFRADMGGPGLAIISCHVGYMSMVEDLIYCASKEGGEEGDADIAFRVRRPAETHTAARGPGLKYGALIKVMVDEAAGTVEDFIDEWAKAADVSCAKLEAGYKADDLVQDMADCWVRMLREGARLADVGLRVARTAPRAGDQPAPRPATRAPVEL